MGWDNTADDTACTYDTAVTYDGISEDNCVYANPAFRADSDRADRIAVTYTIFVEFMVMVVNADIGGEKGIAADSDFAVTAHNHIFVYADIFAHGDDTAVTGDA